MGQVIQIHHTTAGKVKGVSHAIAIHNSRLCIVGKEAADLERAAIDMLRKGHSASWSVAVAKAMAKRSMSVRLA